MKKIPTLFERQFENHKIVRITDKVTPGFEWVLEGDGLATIKFDGSCCAIIDGKFYKRFDAKKGRKIPEGAIPCCEPDPVTGHWPHWVLVDENNPADKWFVEAYTNAVEDRGSVHDGVTYEAIGPHFQGNPYNLEKDILVMHGIDYIDTSDGPVVSFESIKEFLEENEVEGIVFWRNGYPQCKIKRTDFGFEWPIKRG